MEQKHEQLELRNQELLRNEVEIEQFQKELDDRNKDLEFRNTELSNRDEEIRQLQAKLDHRRQELIDRVEDLRLSRLDVENRIKEIEKLDIEKNQLNSHLHGIKDSIESPVIITDNDNIVTVWNKKAQEMLGLESERAIGKNLLEIELMRDNRLVDAKNQSQQDKKPVTARSILINDQDGNRILTNISHMPLFNDKNELSLNK